MVKLDENYSYNFKEEKMGDLKLFDIEKGVRKLKGSFVILEKSIQTLIEKNLEIFFGIRFLSSEYSTGNFKTGDGSLFDKNK